MRIGTKSVLFGVHAFWLHPFLLAWAWWRLWGWRTVTDHATGLAVSLRDWRLWLVFFVHDLGYWGQPNMDGPEGEMHPFWGAKLLTRWCDKGLEHVWVRQGQCWLGPWGMFVLLHSRFLAKALGRPFSLLCVADKLVIAAEPSWLYLPRVRASGEVYEYMAKANGRYAMGISVDSQREWHQGIRDYCRRWVEEHRDGRDDTWTPSGGERVAATASGVWQ